ncbi:MAG TPA: ASCH domain-containing protein [Methylomirabilota bacterium]
MTSERVEAFWREYLDTIPAGHTHRRARPAVFAFGDSPSLADELAALVAAGRKRATTSLPIELTADGAPVPGDVAIVTCADGTPAAVIEYVEVRHVPFHAVDGAYAAVEGEGDGSLAWWRAAHRAYFARVGARSGVAFDEGTIVVCQRFDVLWPPRP